MYRRVIEALGGAAKEQGLIAALFHFPERWMSPPMGASR